MKVSIMHWLYIEDIYLKKSHDFPDYTILMRVSVAFFSVAILFVIHLYICPSDCQENNFDGCDNYILRFKTDGKAFLQTLQ